MIPQKSLPIDSGWQSDEAYVNSLLTLVTSSDLLRNLCGGVHILDFLTREPDLYSWVLDEDWRTWFEVAPIEDLLDLLLREHLDQFHSVNDHDDVDATWRGLPIPPVSLISYIKTIRKHSLIRSFKPVEKVRQRLPRRVEVGMKPKKIHEVANFAAYVSQLSTYVSEKNNIPVSVIDFGSGQNYLGRTLALPPYNKHVIAIERQHHNVEGARGMDVSAKLAKKEKIMRNKKFYNMQQRLLAAEEQGLSAAKIGELREKLAAISVAEETPQVLSLTNDGHEEELSDIAEKGSMTYIEHELVDGYLEEILHPHPVPDDKNNQHNSKADPDLSFPDVASALSIAVSIHSCGNLTHHGLRSLILNHSVSAVAMIGCCYNLLTERLGPATYKLPQLRPNHPRLEATSSTYDMHGFPMSRALEDFEFDINTNKLVSYESLVTNGPPRQREKGVRLNITARMMAVQAPLNWTPEESALFFTRHFYRALLQRVLLDRGVVKQALSSSETLVPGGSLSGKDVEGTPLIIGSLRKSAFTSFSAYVEAALEKLYADATDGPRIKELTRDLLTDLSIIREYETRFAYAKKHLSVIWSLMAFSAGVIESTIVVDRWLWLKEQNEVEEAWVETAFGYDLSPRNLVVVGIKKPNHTSAKERYEP